MSNIEKLKNLLKGSGIIASLPPDEAMNIFKLIADVESEVQESRLHDLWYNNIILSTDAYKCSHYQVYPENTEFVYSYIESRGSDRKWTQVQFFGLQAFMKRYLRKPITQEYINFAEKYITGMGLPFNKEGWEYILRVHGGRLPIKIKAVKEGLVTKTKNVLVTVINTDPNCGWLTNYIETCLLRAVWYPSTVATLSLMCKVEVLKAYLQSSDIDIRNIISDLSFKLNDFGARGVSSKESAMLGGMGHLINWKGTDNIEAVVAADILYNNLTVEEFLNPARKPNIAGQSLPAAEHSTVTSWGKNHENKAYAAMLAKYAKPGSLVAVVSDSYDLWNAITEIWGKQLKKQVIASGATIVIRPDCYDSETEILTENGWIKFPDLEDNIKVVQVHDNWETSLVKPFEIVRQKYDGEMIKFSDEKGRLDLLVTPNHRMVLSDNVGRLHVSEAKDSKFYHNRNIPRVAVAQDNETSLSAYERFLIAFQADGSYPSGWFDIQNPGSLCGHVRTRFNFQKRRKIKRLEEICKEAGLKYDIQQEKERGKKLDQYTFYVNVPLDKTLSKTFDWVKPMERDYNWCHEFIRELSNWDATERTIDRIKYDTTISENAEIAQLVAIRGGWGCTYSIHEDNRSEKFNDVHSLSITGKIVVGGQSIKKETIDYSGMVYCVKVPTGKIVVRRNRKVVVCGNSGDPLTVPVKVVQMLAEIFGYTVNSKGYKVLNSCVRVIQGDGITEASLPIIIKNLLDAGFSIENLAFGMGGGLLQLVNRDTLKWAMKCSAISIGGVWYDVRKEPITDPGKRSKAGRFALVVVESDGEETGLTEYVTVPLIGPTSNHEEIDMMQTVYEDGILFNLQTWDDICELSHRQALMMAGIK